MRPLWTSLALLLASLLHVEGYTCPSGKSKETITLAVGESVDFSTQDTETYGKNVKCVVKFKRGKRSKCKLNFSCSAFTLTAKNSNCNKGSDFVKIGKEKFCEDNSPDVTVNGRTLNVLFRSNKRSKGGEGAECTATCIDNEEVSTTTPAASTEAPTTTPSPATTAAPTTGGGASSQSLEKRSLIENGDFEDSILPWRSQGCSISLSETEAYSGQKSLFVEDRTAKWAGPVAGIDIYAMRGAVQLELSWAMKASPGFTYQWTIRKSFASGEKEFTQVSSGEVSQTDGWSQFSVNFTLEIDLTSNAAALDIYLGGTPTYAAFYLDQVDLQAVIASNPNKGRKNILFIGADDLRPNLGTYKSVTLATLGGPTMHTPNIDKMAERGIVFEKAFVQQAVCSPSRVSMMTGRRPDTTKVMDLDTYFRDVGANFTTIPQFFKQQGYKSINIGKMFHRSGPGGDDDISWTEKYVAGGAYRGNGDSWEAVAQGTQLVDTLEADHVIERLGQLAPEVLAGEENFFLGWGLRRPHLPFLFPQQFAELYPEENIQLPVNSWTNFEIATHAPLILSLPGTTDTGLRSSKLVEFVDIFPALVEATGFQSLDICPKISNTSLLCTEGSSLMPLLQDPESPEWKSSVFWQYPRGGYFPDSHVRKVMGYSIRTPEWRYTEWVGIKYKGNNNYSPDWHIQKAKPELYSVLNDPQENFNVAEKPENAEVVESLSLKLRSGWRAAVTTK